MNKKSIVISLFLLVLAGLIWSVDSKSYVYGYYRIINGSSIPGRDASLASGFFFYKKDESNGKFVVFNKDVNEIPLYVDLNRKNKFLALLSDGKVETRLKRKGCTAYEDKTTPKNIYIEYDASINAILGVDEIAEKDLLILCGMLEETQ